MSALQSVAAVQVRRQIEVSALSEALARFNVTVVAGPEGIGKASMASWTLHSAFPDRVETMRCVRLGGEQPAEAVVQALTANAYIRTDDWTPVFRDPIGLATSALDLAESWENEDTIAVLTQGAAKP